VPRWLLPGAFRGCQTQDPTVPAPRLRRSLVKPTVKRHTARKVPLHGVAQERHDRARANCRSLKATRMFPIHAAGSLEPGVGHHPSRLRQGRCRHNRAFSTDTRHLDRHASDESMARDTPLAPTAASPRAQWWTGGGGRVAPEARSAQQCGGRAATVRASCTLRCCAQL
jgi:hypothetical protein